MSASFVSQHPFQSLGHRLLFAVHDVAFFGFLGVFFAHLLSIFQRRWRLHQKTGTALSKWVMPALLVSGFALCGYVRPSEDAIIFVAYGVSVLTLYVQLFDSSMVWSWRLTHLVAAGLQLWALVYLFREMGPKEVRNKDLFAILLYCPWMHGAWAMYSSAEQLPKKYHIHRTTGSDLLYLGLMGTVFSFSHEPFYRPPFVSWLYIFMHLVYVHRLRPSS